MSETEWKPIETIPRGKELAGRGFLIAAFDPNNPYEDGTLGPEYVEWGNGPHINGDDVEEWLNFNSGNYSIWKPAPTHWAHLPKMIASAELGYVTSMMDVEHNIDIVKGVFVSMLQSILQSKEEGEGR